MTDSKHNERDDKSLGMDRRICRRDFLNSTLLASGSLLLSPLAPNDLLAQGSDWTGYGGVGDYQNSNGNTAEVMNAGHQIRDHVFDGVPANATQYGRNFRLRGGGRWNQRTGGCAFLSQSNGRQAVLPGSGKPPHVRRRGQAK